jgi:mono/diheme cytochrome c family protein
MSALPLVLSGAILLSSASAASAQDAAKFFDDNCGVCHAIGGPPGGAPDLRDITKRRDRRWLVQFILNPEAVAKTDATAAALVKQFDDNVMPTTDGATPELVEALLRYIDAQSGAAAASTPASAAPPRVATQADLAVGRDLYDGRRRLAARGPSCVSCHHFAAVGGLGGGTLGPDLTRVRERLGGTRGLTAWLGNPPTRVMRAVFRLQPMADDEVFAIAAMLGESPLPPAAARGRTAAFVASGAAAALVALAAMAIVWSRRLRGVRRALVEAGRRSGGER